MIKTIRFRATRKRRAIPIPVIALVLVLAACTARIDTRGNLPDPDLLAGIEVGQTNRESVEDRLGSPSAVATFDNETWYYISQRTETRAFLAPEVKARKVVIIRFDAKGVVSEIKTLGLEQSKELEIVERKTPTAGTEITILKQLFGNIGRFGKPGG